MTRYPQGIPASTGEWCRYCGKRKNFSAKICRRCSPIFKSYSAAQSWAKDNASGPCVMAFEDRYRRMCSYIEWRPGVGKGAAA